MNPKKRAIGPTPDDPAPDAGADTASSSVSGTDGDSSPIVARIVQPQPAPQTGDGTHSESSDIRTGSPFKPNTNHELDFLVEPSQGADDLGHVSVTSETARGAIIAALVILPLAAVSIVWFPTGSMAVAGLGAVMGLIGTTSRNRKTALSVLILHFVVLGFAFSSVV